MSPLHLSGETSHSSESTYFQLMDHLLLSGETHSSSKSIGFQIPVASSFRDWTELLPELVDMILKRLHEFSDYMHFCGVCSRWRLAALRDTSGHRQNFDLFKATHCKLPMLLFKTEENNYDERFLYSVVDGKTYKLQLSLPCRRRFVGSSHGWLICSEEDEVIFLLNPMTKGFIPLPNFHYSHVHWDDVVHNECYLTKAILTADPHVRPNDYVVVIIYGSCCDLAVYRSGDTNWKFIDLGKGNTYIDIVCHRNNIYGLTTKGDMLLVDPDSGTAELIVKDNDRRASACYIVESQGELLLIQRTWSLKKNLKMIFDINEEEEEVEEEEDNDDDDDDDDDDGDSYDRDHYIHPYRSVTIDFTIFKLLCEKGCAKFVQVNNIGKQALFVGENHSVSISTLEFPDCQPNSIYFNNEYFIDVPPYLCWGLDEDNGIFNIEDKSVHFHHRLDMCERYMNPPIWFVANLAKKAWPEE